jgi:hypothetical protein
MARANNLAFVIHLTRNDDGSRDLTIADRLTAATDSETTQWTMAQLPRAGKRR